VVLFRKYSGGGWRCYPQLQEFYSTEGNPVHGNHRVSLRFFLYAVVDPGSLGSRVYSLDAVLDNSIVKGSMNWYDRTDSDHFVFDATPVFLEKLQQAVAKHNLAQHNGYVYTVSGLPDMYGAKLDIVYQSGEAIYANDNQDCFLSMEAMEDLVKVFREYARR